MKTKKLQSLSPQNLLDCVRTSITDGCNGGIMTDAYNWVKNNGIMNETSYPYQTARKSCRYVPSENVTSCKGFVKLPSGSESELKRGVATIGPISIGIQAALPSMQFYSKGIYFDSDCNDKINHAVLVVGYGSENGTDYWIIKNSWSHRWGGKMK